MGSYCRVVGGEGYREDGAEPWEERAVTPAGCTAGALHGETCRMFFLFLFFFIALSKKGDFTRQAWLMLLIDLSC